MSQVVFGRRGLDRTQPASPRAAAPRPSRLVEPGAPIGSLASDERASLASAPWLTTALIFLLLAIFMIEKAATPTLGDGGLLEARDLADLGAASRALVVDQHQYWRVLFSPLLHANFKHVFFNCIPLLIFGALLELMVGRGWLLAIFVFSALTGVAGSLIGNPPSTVTVGASGALTGLFGAMFVLSYHGAVGGTQRDAMRSLSWRFAMPAIIPVFFSSGHVDYAAHIGGACGGAFLALGLLAFFDESRLKPRFGVLAGAIAALFFVSAAVSLPLARLDRAEGLKTTAMLREKLTRMQAASAEICAALDRGVRSQGASPPNDENYRKLRKQLACDAKKP
ncbi:rhomboid family intramembrane serine protease [Rhodoblastus sp.]|uniref:rhomboid family intramembrane serine protease n=1 Tax=Rhodoblastus sp. TaxID=1962975 RepID=UPI0035AEB010